MAATSSTAGGTSSHTVEVRAVLEPVGRFAEDFNVCVLGISHNPKAPQAKAINAVVGSGAFVHAPRLVFLAIEDPETPGRNLLLAAKNNIGKKCEGLGYRILDDRFVGPGDFHPLGLHRVGQSAGAHDRRRSARRSRREA